MVAKTRAQLEAEVKHVLDTVLILPADSALHRFMKENSFDQMDQFLLEEDANLQKLTYMADKENGQGKEPKALMAGTIAQVRMLRKFQCHRAQTGKPIDDWTTMTREDYKPRMPPNA